MVAKACRRDAGREPRRLTRHFRAKETPESLPKSGVLTVKAATAGNISLMQKSQAPVQKRDVRIDFFRGLALLFIFVDHIPGNWLADLTMRNFGFADAAEVFVFLAGFSALLAYSKTFEKEGFRSGTSRVGRRIFDLYVWHIGTVVVSLLLLSAAALVFSQPNYLNHIGLQYFINYPSHAIPQAAVLYYQQNMLNILPLYILLLAWFPVMYWLLRRSHALVLIISAAIWLAAYAGGLGLPGHPVWGWFFNPFAWQLLLTLGAVAADRVRRNMPLYEAVLLPPAAAYALFACLVIAPWTRIPGLESTRLLPGDLLGAIDKTNLSPLRILHIVALGYIVAACVPASARWLTSPGAGVISRCGQHSLEIFCLGTLLSFSGWVVMQEAGTDLTTQIAVNTIGISVLGVTAWYLAQRKLGRSVGLVWPSVPLFNRVLLPPSR